MKKQFEEYLINKGYKQTTPSGRPSTVYDYIKRIDKICEWENMTWEQLAGSIQKLLSIYDIGGKKEDQGKLSHNAVISALKRFYDFVMREKLK
jgi:site-specific recombinase XerD